MKSRQEQERGQLIRLLRIIQEAYIRCSRQQRTGRDDNLGMSQHYLNGGLFSQQISGKPEC